MVDRSSLTKTKTLAAEFIKDATDDHLDWMAENPDERVSASDAEVEVPVWLLSELLTALEAAQARAEKAEASLVELARALRIARDFAETEVESREHAGGSMSDYINEAQEVVDACNAALRLVEANR